MSVRQREKVKTKKNYSDIILFYRTGGTRMEDAGRPIAVFDSGVGGIKRIACAGGF